MAGLLLVAAVAVGAVALVVRGHDPAPAGPVTQTADAAPGSAGPPGSAAPPGSAGTPGDPTAVPLPGSISLAAIPAPLAGESATGGSSTGELTITDPPAGTPATPPAGTSAAGTPPADPPAGTPPADPPAGTPATPAAVPPGPSGVPGVPLAAYRHAEQVLGVSQSACQLHWPLLAAIGRAESGNAQGGRVDAAGHTLGRILGPRLDGSPGLPRLPDTDRGQLDGDSVWDRAVGPMQLLPSVWRRYAADGDGDGRTDPNDIYDAALTTARYLCAGGVNLGDPDQLGAAVFRYRHSPSYVTAVRTWAAGYANGSASVPLLVPPPRAAVVLPPPQASGVPPAPVVRPPTPPARPTRPVPGARAATHARPAPSVRAAPATRPAPSVRAAPATRPAPAIPPARYAPGPAPTAPAAGPPLAQGTPGAGSTQQDQGPAGARGPAQAQGSTQQAQGPGSGYVIVIPESASSGNAATDSVPNSATGNNGGAPSYSGQGTAAPGYGAQGNAAPGYGVPNNGVSNYTGQNNGVSNYTGQNNAAPSYRAQTGSVAPNYGGNTGQASAGQPSPVAPNPAG